MKESKKGKRNKERKKKIENNREKEKGRQTERQVDRQQRDNSEFGKAELRKKGKDKKKEQIEKRTNNSDIPNV